MNKRVKADDIESNDQETANKFSTSWNTLYQPSIYTKEQFEDWISPWDSIQIRGKRVLELGCGSGALLDHIKDNDPSSLVGIDLGESINTARGLLADKAQIYQADITDADSLIERFGIFDLVYCIGVLHHLKKPEAGVNSLIKLTREGGSFHAWVYAYEGNALIRYLVDPIRRIVNHFHWLITKYLIALPLSVPFFFYSKFCRVIEKLAGSKIPFPLFSYMLWVGKRGFRFHHHVAFDQLVTPVTHYIKKQQIERWLDHPEVDSKSTYIIFRNGNGWKFGGKRKEG